MEYNKEKMLQLVHGNPYLEHMFHYMVKKVRNEDTVLKAIYRANVRDPYGEYRDEYKEIMLNNNYIKSVDR